MLIGGTTADKTVSSADISQTKGQVGQPVTNSNFREDVRSGGSINATAVRLARCTGHSFDLWPNVSTEAIAFLNTFLQTPITGATADE